jgi:glycosyltransferase involved in cell wall biosynthesis
MTAMRTPNAPTPTAVVVQTCIPFFRRAFFEELRRRVEGDLQLITGADDFSASNPHVGGVGETTVRNRWLLGSRLLWQHGVVRPSLRATVTVMPNNPRMLSTWVVMVLRKVAGRPTLLWGHAWPRKGPEHATERLRSLLRRLSTGLIVYTEPEAEGMRRTHPGLPVSLSPNALYHASEIGVPTEPSHRHTVLSVGRLAPDKRPLALVDAFALAADRLPDDARLTLVGDGELRETTRAHANELGLGDRVALPGGISSVEELRHVYASAVAGISPGVAGLSIFQSLGFGVPFILPPGLEHGPEVYAVADDPAVVWAEDDTPEALANAIVTAFHDRDRWAREAPRISGRISETHTIEQMAQGFADAVNRCLAERGTPHQEA